MDLLADENVEPEWIHALRNDGHDVRRAVEIVEFGTADPTVLSTASERERVLLTADRSDFGDPPSDDHAGIVIIADVTRTGSEVRTAVRRIERAYPDLAGAVAYVGDWV